MFAFAGAMLFVKIMPFPKNERWKTFVKVYLYGLTTFSILVNFLLYFLQHEKINKNAHADDSLDQLVSFLCVLAFALGAGLFFTLIVSFLRTVVKKSIAGVKKRTGNKRVKILGVFLSNSNEVTEPDIPPNGSKPRWLNVLLSKFFYIPPADLENYAKGLSHENVGAVSVSDTIHLPISLFFFRKDNTYRIASPKQRTSKLQDVMPSNL